MTRICHTQLSRFKAFSFNLSPFLRLRLVLVLSVLLLSIGRYQSQVHLIRYYEVVQKYEIDRSFKPHLEDRTEVTYKLKIIVLYETNQLGIIDSGYHKD